MARERRPLVAGNWKMYTTPGEGAVLMQDVAERVSDEWGMVEVVVCPPFTGLKSIATLIELDRLRIGLGAQDCHWETEGAYTGAVSTRMLTSVRCTYVIVGHSERREHFGETDGIVARKVRAVLDAGMKPILCVGEPLSVHEAGEAEEYVREQVKAALDGLTAEDGEGLVIAYEPIWAIGTGHTPVPEVANDVARSIRATVGALWGPPAAMALRILYGGSVKPENARMFFGEPDIDGGLVGGASLEADPFADIVRAAL